MYTSAACALALEPSGHDALVETVRGGGYRLRKQPPAVTAGSWPRSRFLLVSSPPLHCRHEGDPANPCRGRAGRWCCRGYGRPLGGRD